MQILVLYGSVKVAETGIDLAKIEICINFFRDIPRFFGDVYLVLKKINRLPSVFEGESFERRSNIETYRKWQSYLKAKEQDIVDDVVLRSAEILFSSEIL